MANCFSPVIACHLPQLFYLSYGWDFLMPSVGLRPLDQSYTLALMSTLLNMMTSLHTVWIYLLSAFSLLLSIFRKADQLLVDFLCIRPLYSQFFEYSPS